jgi:hypothetical protein
MTMPDTESRASQADQTGQQGSGTAREQIRGMKDQVVDQAKNTFQQARDRATSSLGESKSQVADQFGNLADALRRTTEHLRSEDQQRIAGITETVARQVEQVADYIRNKDAQGMRQDLENLARRQPALMIGGALVLGLVGARFLKSSERRGGRRFGDGRQFGREGRFGYTGYDQPYSGDIDVASTSSRRPGYGYPGPESGMGGGYAGA